MKKILALLLAIVTVLGLAACGEKKDDKPAAPEIDATFTTYEWTGGATPWDDAVQEYIDGEWMYVYKGTGKNYTDSARYGKLAVGNLQKSVIIFKIKYDDLTGIVKPIYQQCGSLNVTIYDETGTNELGVLAGNSGAQMTLEAGKWYTMKHTKDGLNLTDTWVHLGGFGIGEGGLNVYIKDVVFE